MKETESGAIWGRREALVWGGRGKDHGVMAYEVKVEAKAGYLHVRVTGENSPETVRGYLGEVRAACERARCMNVLVEENLSGPGLGTFDVFGVVSQGSRDATRAMGRVALVDVNPEHDPRLMQFAETVAVNRGMTMRVFATVAEAEAWMREGPVGQSVDR